MCANSSGEAASEQVRWVYWLNLGATEGVASYTVISAEDAGKELGLNSAMTAEFL